MERGHENELWTAGSAVLFLIAVAVCLIFGFSIAWALTVGYLCFLAASVKNGGRLSELLKETFRDVKKMSDLLWILLLLGALTASWRAGGTVLLFVYYGVKLISPPLFLLVTFCAASALGYIIGTSFGVSGIMGAIFMTIGRAGGVNPLLTAGAILSGVYFGDRTSPASSSFLTISVLLDIKIGELLKKLLRDAALPFAICLSLYVVLSVLNPIRAVDSNVLDRIAGAYRLNWMLLLPAVVILLFPLLHLKSIAALLLSTALSGAVAVAVQGMTVTSFLATCLRGYVCPDAYLGAMVDGGGILGMMEICAVVCVASMLSPVLRGSGIVDLVFPRMERAAKKIGLTTATTAAVFAMNAVFCNQSAPLYLTDTFVGDLYEDKGRMAVDMSDASILAGLIPWSLACSVPLSFLNVGVGCLPFAFFLYLTPLCNCIVRRSY